MKSLRVFIIICVALALACAAVGCKKKEVKPTVATAGTAAKTAEVAVSCPKPGEDLICQDCKTLFMSDKEYAEHMEKQHPEKWTKMKDKFWDMRKGETAGTAKTK